MLGKVQVIHIKYKYSKNTTRQKASVINKALRGFFLFVYKAKLRVSAEKSKRSVYSTFTDYLRCSLDNNSMRPDLEIESEEYTPPHLYFCYTWRGLAKRSEVNYYIAVKNYRLFTKVI
jgi:hypothetical protein